MIREDRPDPPGTEERGHRIEGHGIERVARRVVDFGDPIERGSDFVPRHGACDRASQSIFRLRRAATLFRCQGSPPAADGRGMPGADR